MKFRITAGVFLVSSVLLTLFVFGSNAYAQEADPTPTIEASSTSTSTPVVTETVEAVRSSSTAAGDSESGLSITSSDLINLGFSALIFFFFYLFGGRLVVSILQKLAKRSPSEFVDKLIVLIAPGIGSFITALGLQIAALRLDFIGDSLRDVLQNIFFLFYWYVIMKILWDLINFSADWYFDHAGKEDRDGMFEQLRPLIKRVSQIVVGFLGIIVLMGHFGVSVLAIMATLGLTGFALALALKDTITNIISGFIIMATQPFVVGDRIEVAEIDAWADVVSIGYRSTTCVTRDNREVIVPNGNIVDNTIINYSRPDASYRLQQDMDVGGDMDIGKVVKVIMEAVLNTEGVMEDKPVDVLFTGYGTALTFRVRWWIKNYGDKRAITHRVMTAIQEAAEKENINMPDPAFIHDTKLSIGDDELDKISSKFEGRGGSK
jgi:small-conductance mechanosensitive channel